MSDNSWDHALDQLEALLRRQEAVVDYSSPLPEAFLPVGDGPMPERLRARASALLERTRQLEERTEAAMAVLRRRRPTFATGTQPGTDLGLL
jgi:hypothetical protein